MPGDHVAVVSPSWGGPSVFPLRYEAGITELKKQFNVHVIDMPHARAEAQWLKSHPKERADDLMAAFRDPKIKAIIASIGGDDSVRLLPYLDLDVIAQNPKIVMGYSDTTVLYFVCYAARLTSFYGPSIMAGFAENGGMHEYTLQSVQQIVQQKSAVGHILPSESWTVEHLDWGNLNNQNQVRSMRENKGPTVIQGQGITQGHLMGGCIEVLEMIKGTKIWPGLDEWRDAILFLETSEDAPRPDYIRYCLRNYAAQGILQGLKGIIFGRPGGSNLNDTERLAYDDVLLSVVRDEEGLKDLPIMTQMDFGHTDPMMVLPYGCLAEINCVENKFSILEPGVIA